MTSRRYVNRQEAYQRFGPLARCLEDHLSIGDPLADAVIGDLAAMPRHRAERIIEQALDLGIDAVPDASESLHSLFRQLDQVPSWVDWELLECGARTYRRLGLAKVAILISVSLMRGYHSSAVNKPLIFTNRLEYATRKRLGNTGEYIHCVSQPGALYRFAPGFRAVVRVRLLHARVRSRLLQSEAWSTDDWGIPINQADICATALAFSLAVLVAARQLGFRFSPRESEGVMHLWRYIGFLIGLEPVLSWSSEHEALRLGELIDLTQPGADDWSVKLATALRNLSVQMSAERSLPERWAGVLWRHCIDGLTREFNGPAVADELGIPTTPWVFCRPAIKALVTPFELLRPLVPGATALMSAVGNWMFAQIVDYTLNDPSPPLDTAQDAPPRQAVIPTYQQVPSGRGPAEAAPRRAGALYDYQRSTTSRLYRAAAMFRSYRR